MILAAFAAVAMLSGYIGFSNLEKPEANSLAIANVEALSNDEYEYSNGKEHTFECGAYISSTWWGKTITCTFVVITCPAGGEGCNPRTCKNH